MVDSPGSWQKDASLSGPGCKKNQALRLWNSCVEESQGSRVRPCLGLGRNEKVLITTVMPACQSPPTGLSRPCSKDAAANGAERGRESFRSRTQKSKQLPTLWSVMKAAQEFILHWGLKTNHLNNSLKKPYLSVWTLFERTSRVTAGCQSLLFLTARSTNQA